ncbi:MAG TPA: protein kinase [Vicinamibacterales bacterium]|nr:protein kinase [Vicinamibacterales bacterium]
MLTGRTLGPYQVKEQLGGGGMGVVYKAHDSRLDRVVALKVLPRELASPDRLQRFEQEARAASALNHPNILTIHDVGRDADVAYLAMEWVEGQTLRDVMSGRPLPVRRLVRIAQQIADGLAKAHAAGIVHRDLKPENVMLTPDGLVKIVDFGIAKLEDPAAGGPADAATQTVGTSPGMVLGTLGYMSPEQASGKPVDYRSDQFALGLLIYEMATATRPFKRETTAQSLAATIDVDPTPIDVLNPDIPAHLAAVVARCLAKDPFERYESTRDLARDLTTITVTSASGAVRARGTLTSHSRVYAAAAIVLLAIAGTAAWWWWRPSPAPAEKPRPLIAVRPFRSLSADPGQGYFAAGVTEEIRGQLSQISSLRLLSRNALEAATGSDSPRLVRDLGVTQLVDGSVRLEGPRVRVTAELVDASTQQTLWSDQYDRDVADVLAVQTDVALQISRALRANLSPDEEHRLGQRPTSSPEAYRMYLQARPASAFDRARNLAAIELLRKAIALDPSFAPAYASMGFRQTLMGYYDAPSYIDEGIRSAETALQYNPSLPGAYFVIGSGYVMKGQDAKARLALLRTLELDPNHTLAMSNLSVLYSNFGRPSEGLIWARRMFALSGKDGNDFYHLGVPLVTLRADDVADRVLTEAERRHDRFTRTHVLRSYLEWFLGRGDSARNRIARALERWPEDEELKFLRADFAYLLGSADLDAALAAIPSGGDASTNMVPLTIGLRRGYLLARRGREAQARAVFAEAERSAVKRMADGDNTPSLRIELAAIAALKKDFSGAITWLDRAYDAGYRDYAVIDRDPILLTIEPQATFRDVLERMRRDLEAQRAQARHGGLLDVDALLGPAR